ncbi:uncharacterized protein KY384_002932 [Bacidia gigantensis]|uniref:uncharacterized protein n=1 Tax=Bacidia gigantensis TaxID=2732470 RepID=UPI001D04E3AE|nr:uncharacterized protein KY384_002932 [Bacidia gigantensis]KAG8531304.1 hypothetical protein KY384_002932 [Bacidia gigantensis]
MEDCSGHRSANPCDDCLRIERERQAYIAGEREKRFKKWDETAEWWQRSVRRERKAGRMPEIIHGLKKEDVPRRDERKSDEADGRPHLLSESSTTARWCTHCFLPFRTLAAKNAHKEVGRKRGGKAGHLEEEHPEDCERCVFREGTVGRPGCKVHGRGWGWGWWWQRLWGAVVADLGGGRDGEVLTRMPGTCEWEGSDCDGDGGGDGDGDREEDEEEGVGGAEEETDEQPAWGEGSRIGRYGGANRFDEKVNESTDKTEAFKAPEMAELKVEESLIPLYSILKLDPSTPASKIKKAAREARIKMHPDRLDRRQSLTPAAKDLMKEEAKRVGWAADILTDPEEKERYLKECEEAAQEGRTSRHNPFVLLMETKYVLRVFCRGGGHGYVVDGGDAGWDWEVTATREADGYVVGGLVMLLQFYLLHLLFLTSFVDRRGGISELL